MDGWSSRLFVSEMEATHVALQKGILPEIEPQFVQYVDFSQWQRTQLSSGAWSPQVLRIPRPPLPSSPPPPPPPTHTIIVFLDAQTKQVAHIVNLEDLTAVVEIIDLGVTVLYWHSLSSRKQGCCLDVCSHSR